MVKTKGTLEWAKNNFNISIGCLNDCRYCYAKSYADFYNRVQRAFWCEMYTKPINQITAQLNRLPKPANDPELYDVMFPSSHDIHPENLDEAVYAIGNILEKGLTLLIVSKPKIAVISELVYRFQDYKDQILFRFTLTSSDDEMIRFWEGSAPLARERMICLYLAYSTGFQTSVSIEPFLEDYALLRHIETIQKYVTENIWVGPMNFKYVVKSDLEEFENLFGISQKDYYTSENLIRIKKEIDSLSFDNIRYKDHFLNKIKLEVST